MDLRSSFPGTYFQYLTVIIFSLPSQVRKVEIDSQNFFSDHLVQAFHLIDEEAASLGSTGFAWDQ